MYNSGIFQEKLGINARNLSVLQVWNKYLQNTRSAKYSAVVVSQFSYRRQGKDT